jgi:hypothetical protein
MRNTLSILFGIPALIGLVSCGPSADEDLTGQFFVTATNLGEGAVWELNRPIRMEFNHPVDMTSVSFSSIRIRPLNPQVVQTPVTGSFEVGYDEDGQLDKRVVVFRPTCPTNQTNSNGAFLGGGFGYEIYVPISGQATTVLRDTGGRALSKGMRRTFQTPAASNPQFLDLTPGPPAIENVEYPEGLNLFSNPDPIVSITFDQSIDGRPSNLNTNNLYVLYADGELGSPSQDIFPPENKLPGRLVLIENCSDLGAEVHFLVAGVMPVNRNIRLQMSSQFGDLIGQTNVTTVVMPNHETPTLTQVYNDPSWNEVDETADEYRDDYTTAQDLDLAAEIPLPLAKIGDGFVAADFDFPGSFVSSDNDLFLGTNVYAEVFTTGQSTFTDSNSRQHTVINGVMEVDDVTISSGATLRARGKSPLIIYASGNVVINGTINISGNNSNWPTGLNSPQFVEGGALGEAGGGRGGDASQIALAETPRAESGDGPFGLEGGGGQGGEGGFNGDKGGPTGSTGIANLQNTVAGGGGGGFALTENASVWWYDWPAGAGWKPSGVDNNGPDHFHVSGPFGQANRHTALGPKGSQISRDWFAGAEAGNRASSYQVDIPIPSPGAYGIFGMEDVQRDDEAVPADSLTNLDPAWTSGPEPPFPAGHPTKGPDGGQGGPSVFSADGNTDNDFWGRRLNSDGSVAVGELLAPWAGSGGGGGGDSMILHREDFDGDMNLDPIETLYPVVPFQRSTFGLVRGWYYYRKGAAGGGGAGQLQIMAIGEIAFGNNSKILGNGGVGFAGESMIYTDNTVSGSGGGSGGHVILHSATGMDFSAVDVGTLTINGSELDSDDPANIVQAFGGRRGWAASDIQKLASNPGLDDGNATFMVGRGGAGANGVIQIHVPDPYTDIVWPTGSGAAGVIANYFSQVGETTDAVEEVLDLFCEPAAYSLIPFFSSSSMVQSDWVDTGLAGLRLSVNQTAGSWDYPDYANALLDFTGIFPSGLVIKAGEQVQPLGDIATGPLGSVTISSFGMTLPSASAFLDAKYLRSPNLLIGYDILPDKDGDSTFEIVAANYTRSTDRMVLTTRVSDSAMDFAVNQGNPFWSIKEKFFRVETSGLKDNLPDSTEITLQFQGANESFPGSNLPGPAFPGVRTWTSNLSELTGYRFVRYRVTFEADAQGEGIGLGSPLPLLDYIKIPFVW